MSAILVQCPQTLQEVPVGLETDYRSFHSLPDFQSTMRCPACCGVHLWSTESAIFSDDDPQPHPQMPKAIFHNLSGRRWAA